MTGSSRVPLWQGVGCGTGGIDNKGKDFGKCVNESDVYIINELIHAQVLKLDTYSQNSSLLIQLQQLQQKTSQALLQQKNPMSWSSESSYDAKADA